MTNTVLWDQLFQTDPAHTKKFKGAGGFEGTAIKPYWIVKRMTETFGAMGIGWGWDIHEEKTYEASNGEVLWMSRVSIWYVHNNQRFNTSQNWGQTKMLAKRQTGVFLDEEAPKKSVTDAFTKCASYLGLGGDVHMGLFDDSKYVQQALEDARSAKKEASAVKTAAEQKKEEPKGIFLDLGNGDGQTFASATAWLDGLEGALSDADDPVTLYGLNEANLKAIQSIAEKKQQTSVVGRCQAITAHVTAGDIPGVGG